MNTIAAATNIFVSPNGDDANPGTRARPVGTLARAQQAARAAGSGARVVLRDGFYPLPEPLRFGPEDSGTSYVADADATPVISGGRRVTGWTQEGKLWRARVEGGPRALFVNGERRTRARVPATGFFTGLRSTDGVTLTFPKGQLRRWSNWDDVELITLVEWTSAHVRLKGARLDEAKNQIVFPRLALTFFDMDWSAHIRANVAKYPYYFENAPEMLDAPGEWHCDRARGVISYRPLPGERPDRVEAIVPGLEHLVLVDGATNLTFRGLTFAHADWRLPENGFLPLQTCVTVAMQNEAFLKDVSAPAAVRFERAVGCKVERCRFAHLGANGLSFERGCRDNQIVGNRVADIGGNGIQLGEVNSTSPAAADLVKDNTIAHNTVLHCGVTLRGSAGIFVALAEGTTVAHNEVFDLPYSGICIGWRWDRKPTQARSNRVERNHIHHVGKILADGGGIYTLGVQPDSVLRGNLIHDAVRVTGLAPFNAVFLDNGSSGWLIEENMSYGIKEAGLRFNDTGPEFGRTGPQFQKMGQNFFDVTTERLPAHLRARVGPSSEEGKDQLP